MQDRALNRGPKPSLAVVEDGDDTQSFLNKLCPKLKGMRSSKDKLLAGCAKALGDAGLCSVAAPAVGAFPWIDSSGNEVAISAVKHEIATVPTMNRVWCSADIYP